MADLSQSIFWLVLPSLPFFLLLPYLLRRGLNFYVSLGAATATLLALYLTLTLLLTRSVGRPEPSGGRYDGLLRSARSHEGKGN